MSSSAGHGAMPSSVSTPSQTTIQAQLALLVQRAIAAAQASDALPAFDTPAADGIPIERPKQAGHGDFATPIAMHLTKLARQNPRAIAQALVDHLPTDETPLVDQVEIAGPGFINFRLSPDWLAAQVDRILAAGPAYADVSIGHGQPALVEFVSANPTGPLTVGHGRGAVIGDTLSNILAACGYTVTREYYFNDGGLQMRNLAESVRLRARELNGETVEFPENYYVGEYIRDIAAGWLRKHEQESDGNAEDAIDADWTQLRDYAVEAIFADIRGTMARLRIEFDSFVNEMDFFDRDKPNNVWAVVEQLRERGLAFDDDGAVWFAATEFGAGKDRVLVRSTGEPTYRLPDIAYHVYKLKRGFVLAVNVLGADHIAQYPDIVSAVSALGYDATRLHVITNQFVTLVRDGQVVKMSTRRATYVTLDELIDEVGVDAVRYFMISRAPESQFEFDLNLATAQSDENPVYYIQYAHARTAGIMDRTASTREIDYDAAADVSLLTHPAESALVKEILRLREMLAFCAERFEPHHLAYYARDLAVAFNQFYRDCRVVDPANIPLSQARLKMVQAARIALARTLDVMGMDAPDEM